MGSVRKVVRGSDKRVETIDIDGRKEKEIMTAGRVLIGVQIGRYDQ